MSQIAEYFNVEVDNETYTITRVLEDRNNKIETYGFTTVINDAEVKLSTTVTSEVISDREAQYGVQVVNELTDILLKECQLEITKIRKQQ
jgi:hypothetical protein